MNARARVRAEISREILDAAKHEVAADGASGLSLRAVARRVGMVPSALYRYFPSRDDLLTALIVDAYDALGSAVEAADQPGATPMERWLAVAGAARAWAGGHVHDWALLYGTPVTGYQAPEATIEPALRITRVVAGIFAAALPPGPAPQANMPAAPTGLDDVVAPMRDLLLPGRGADSVAGVLIAWAHLIGIVSLELFGHFKGATTDFERLFDYTVRAVGELGGLISV
ncbi:MAG TPA: TetR/AcrR family transcriptional regulator [Acidimicrobiales bacterium]|nr:TetR/AcrR family transcriptional regulator [Acidimicrobiales bacterium]